MSLAKRPRQDDGNDSFDEDDYDPRPSAYMMTQQTILSQRQQAQTRVVKPITPRRTIVKHGTSDNRPSGTDLLLKNKLHNEKRLREKLERERNEMCLQLTQKDKLFQLEKTKLETMFRTEVQSLKNQITSMTFDQSRLNCSTSVSQLGMNESHILNDTVNSTSPAIPTKRIGVPVKSRVLQTGWSGFPFQGDSKRIDLVKGTSGHEERDINETFAHMPSQTIGYNPAQKPTVPDSVPFCSLRKDMVDCGSQADLIKDMARRTDPCRERGLAQLILTISSTSNLTFDPLSIEQIALDKKQTTLGKIFKRKEASRSRVSEGRNWENNTDNMEI